MQLTTQKEKDQTLAQTPTTVYLLSLSAQY